MEKNAIGSSTINENRRGGIISLLFLVLFVLNLNFTSAIGLTNKPPVPTTIIYSTNITNSTTIIYNLTNFYNSSYDAFSYNQTLSAQTFCSAQFNDTALINSSDDWIQTGNSLSLRNPNLNLTLPNTIIVNNLQFAIGGNALCRKTTGEVVDSGALVCSTSSLKYKLNITNFTDVDINNLLNNISATTISSFYYNSSYGNSSQIHVGLIAEYSPLGLKFTDNDGNPNIDFISTTIGYTWGGIKALRKIVNSSWNETYANSKYANIIWGYNQSTASSGTYNSTYDKFSYNQTYSGSTFNQTYQNFAYNQTYISTGTFNSTYASFAYNQSGVSAGTFNQTYQNFAYNQTYNGATFNQTYQNFAYNQTLINIPFPVNFTANTNHSGNFNYIKNLTLVDATFNPITASACTRGQIWTNDTNILVCNSTGRWRKAVLTAL